MKIIQNRILIMNCVAASFLSIGCTNENPVGALTSLRNEIAVVASSTGWLSETGFHADQTPVQKTIVANAKAMNGQLSGQSVSGGCWFTDASGGDGARFISAIKVLDEWYRTYSVGKCLAPPASVLTKMKGKFTGSKYASATVDKIVARIIDRYLNYFVPAHCTTLPSTDDAVLKFLVCQRQCVEWADYIAIKSGGGCRCYSSKTVSDPSKYRLGMGLFKKDIHYMVITDIYFENGIPKRARVAESNYGSGWTNPVGQIPWSRTVAVGRVVDLSGYCVVSFE